LILINETLKFQPFSSAFRFWHERSNSEAYLWVESFIAFLTKFREEEKLEGRFHSASKILKVNQTTFTLIFLSITCFWRTSDSISTNPWQVNIYLVSGFSV
jgi:hypothetical protein